MSAGVMLAYRSTFMHMRSTILLFIVLAIAALAALNWEILAPWGC